MVFKQLAFTGPVNAAGVQQVFLRIYRGRDFDYHQVTSESCRALPFGAADKKAVGIQIALRQAEVTEHFAVHGFSGARARETVQHQFIQFRVVD